MDLNAWSTGLPFASPVQIVPPSLGIPSVTATSTTTPQMQGQLQQIGFSHVTPMGISNESLPQQRLQALEGGNPLASTTSPYPNITRLLSQMASGSPTHSSAVSTQGGTQIPSPVNSALDMPTTTHSTASPTNPPMFQDMSSALAIREMNSPPFGGSNNQDGFPSPREKSRASSRRRARSSSRATSEGGVDDVEEMVGPPNPDNSLEPFGSTSSPGLHVASQSSHKYIDITEYLTLPQSDAAHKLGIPTSTLSKRWKEAVRSRKWPYRTVAKLDKEIMTLLHNIPQGASAYPLSKDVEASLGQLMRRRQEELKPVVIRL